MKPAWRRRCNPRWRRPMAGIADRRQRQLEGIAHDIRGPLTRLLLRVETLREQDSHDPELLAGLEADLMVLLALDQELLAISEPMTPARQRAWVPLAAARTRLLTPRARARCWSRAPCPSLWWRASP